MEALAVLISLNPRILNFYNFVVTVLAKPQSLSRLDFNKWKMVPGYPVALQKVKHHERISGQRNGRVHFLKAKSEQMCLSNFFVALVGKYTLSLACPADNLRVPSGRQML